MKAALSFPGCHRRGGVERIVFECARYLASVGHEVTVVASEWENDPAAPVRYRRVPSRRRPGFLNGLAYYRRCSRELKQMEYDVLNTHGCVCPTGGVHWVQSVHRAWLDRSRRIRGPFSMSAIKQRLNPLHPILLALEQRHFAGRRYRKLIATTEAVRQDLSHYYDVPREDVVVIPNGFAPTEFNPQRRANRREEMRERMQIAPDDVVLLFVANELLRKGYATILEALVRLRAHPLKVLVVGRPSHRAVLDLARQYGVEDRVIACGPTDDVAGFHAAADLFVLPTQYEAFCLAILEALGSGLPVITSDVPGARDAIRAGVNGTTISNPLSGEELAAALLPLLDPTVRLKLSENAPSSVACFEWPTVLKRYEAVLRECCN